jgi:hypothetical protein
MADATLSSTARRPSLPILAGLLAVALAAWATYPAWTPRPIAGVDSIMHVIRTTFGVEHLVWEGRIDGWFPGANLGYQLFQIRGPGVTWLTALVQAASLGQLSTVAALNVVAVGAFIMNPLTVAFAVATAGAGARAAGLAGILSLLVSYPFSEGVLGLFGLGLVENQVGAPFFWTTLGGLARAARRPSTRAIVLPAAAAAGLLLTHLPSAMVLPLLAALHLPWFLLAAPRRGRAIVRLGLAAGLACGLAGFFLVPSLAHHDLVGSVVSARGIPPLRDRAAELVFGSPLFPSHGGWLVLAAWGATLVQAVRGRWLALAWIATPTAYVLLGHVLHHAFPGELAEQLALRGMGYAAVMAVVPLACVLSSFRAARRPLADPVAVAAAAVLAVVSLDSRRLYIHPFPEAPPVLHETAAALARLVPPGARFSTPQHLWYRPESIGPWLPGPDRWLEWQSGCNSLSGHTSESSSTPWVGRTAERVGEEMDEVAADTLARLGVTHLVAPTQALTDRLAGSPRFVLVWQSPPVGILAVRQRPGFPEPASLVSTPAPATARLTRADAEHLRLEVQAPGAMDASIAVAWSPRWHARRNEVPAPLGQTSDGLMELALDAGAHIIELDYVADGSDRAGLAVSMVSVVVAVAVALLAAR